MSKFPLCAQAVVALTLALGSFTANASTPAGGEKPNGTTLVRVARLGDGIYRGSRPSTDADFAYLRSLGIRTILSLQTHREFEPVDSEARNARRLGFTFYQSGVLGLPIQPSEKSIDRAEQVLGDATLRPIYLHCKLGRDRTGLVSALYRVYYENVAPRTAFQEEVIDFGYPIEHGFAHITLMGIKHYFFGHDLAPDFQERAEKLQPLKPIVSNF
jgi:protein tyrosine phosphatase (PTP) superfamily phosphohydrolase (DUF442 family)